VGFATTCCPVHKLASPRILPPAVEVLFAFFHFVSQVAALPTWCFRGSLPGDGLVFLGRFRWLPRSRMILPGPQTCDAVACARE
jgi:hypothetical protein